MFSHITSYIRSIGQALTPKPTLTLPEPELEYVPPSEVLVRARLGMATVTPDQGSVRYRLGQGGGDPHGPVYTYNRDTKRYESDCSGFAAWCCGFRKYRPGFNAGGTITDYLNTDAIYEDSRRRQQLFLAVDKADVKPGDLIVYCGAFSKGKRVGVGHIGVVSHVGGNFDAGRLDTWLTDLSVIHCHGPTGVSKPAITETHGGVFGQVYTANTRKAGFVRRREGAV